MTRNQNVARWMDWEPPISPEKPDTKATEPSKPGFVGSDSSDLGDSEKIRPAGATLQPAEKPLHPAPELDSVGLVSSSYGYISKVDGSKESKLPKITPFQRSFFPDLAKIPPGTQLEFLERSSRRGIPRECAEAYWRWNLQNHQNEVEVWETDGMERGESDRPR